MVLYLLEVRRAVEISWKSWYSMAKRKGLEEFPSFLSGSLKTGSQQRQQISISFGFCVGSFGPQVQTAIITFFEAHPVSNLRY